MSLFRYIENLSKAVAIQSVSAWPHTRDEIVKMIHWAGDELKGTSTIILSIEK